MTEPIRIPYTIDTLEAAQPPLRPFYAAKDGKFHLQLDGEPPGYVPNAKLDEFRQHNRALQKQLAALDGLDPVEHTKLKQEAADADSKLAALTAEKTALEQQLKDFAGIDPIQAKAALAKPDEAARAVELEAKLAAEQHARSIAEVKHAIGFEALRAGALPEALDFIVAEAQKTFTWNMTDGKVTTKALSVTKPGTPLTVSEWVAATARTSAFCFKKSVGGGANGSTRSGGSAQPPSVDGHDPLAVGRALADIASGKVRVTR